MRKGAANPLGRRFYSEECGKGKDHAMKTRPFTRNSGIALAGMLTLAGVVGLDSANARTRRQQIRRHLAQYRPDRYAPACAGKGDAYKASRA